MHGETGRLELIADRAHGPIRVLGLLISVQN